MKEINSPTSTEQSKKKILEQCKELIKIKNRQYAKAQIKWIKNTFMPLYFTISTKILIYCLDASSMLKHRFIVVDKDYWDKNVLEVSCKLIDGQFYLFIFRLFVQRRSRLSTRIK